MGIADLIAQEAMALPAQRQKFWTVDEIEAFFRSFKVKVSDYKFDRDEANAR